MRLKRTQTKIVATLGPACNSEMQISKMIEAGVHAFRFNFSHGRPEEHLAGAQRVRSIAAQKNVHIAILADLQGPKIRISSFQGGKVELVQGQSFTLDFHCPSTAGDAQRVGVDYLPLLGDLCEGDLLILGDGRIKLRVARIESTQAVCQVMTSGTLSDRKGINKQGGGIAAPALTEKDRRDIQTVAAMKADFVCVSFVKKAEDLQIARALVRKAGSNARIIAKIECAEVVNHDAVMNGVLQACDVVMVARGDLGVAIGDPALAAAQKKIIKCSKQLGKTVITATQMMESMIHSPVPTRAEVLDVSNAILDGTDAVMLSAETAIGQFPVETVEKVSEICAGVEASLIGYNALLERSNTQEILGSKSGAPLEQIIASAAAFSALVDREIQGILVFTETAQTVMLLSSLASGLPIISLSPYAIALQQSNLCRGVIPLFFPPNASVQESEEAALTLTLEKGLFQEGKKLLLIRSEQGLVPGGSYTCRVLVASRPARSPH